MKYVMAAIGEQIEKYSSLVQAVATAGHESWYYCLVLLYLVSLDVSAGFRLQY